VAPRPSYPLLEPLARIEHVRLRDYRLTYDGRWALDLESLEAALGPRTRAVVVVEPNNPTGSRFTATERVAVESICADRGIAIISDEVFGDFPWPPRTEPLPGWNNGLPVPTFVLGGISKLCGLPQMKLGWIAACGPEAALRDSLHGLEWIADLFLSVGAPVQVALPRLLEDRVGFHAAVRSRMEATLTVLRGRAGRSAFTLLEGEGGWSAILRFADRDAEQENVAEWALRSHDVLLHPGHYYDLPREDDAVISLLTEPAIVKEAIGRLGGWGHSGPVR
jgi:alanine-synthesizing transaminase